MSEYAIGRERAVPAENPQAAPRYAFLDGMRGFCALYVALFHIWQLLGYQFGAMMPKSLRLSLYWTSAGRSAVPIFIVLSGYCLMLPVLTNSGALRGGFGGFLKRRAKRIFPAYYAMIAIMLVVGIFVDPSKHWQTGWSQQWPLNTPDVILSHLFMVHNLSEAWAWKIDAAMWSLATEWQIYFIFALVLLPLWRRFGIGIAVASAFAIGLSVHFLAPSVDVAAPWFVGLFALGMMAAVCTHGKAGFRAVTMLRRVPWRGVMYVSGAAVVGALGLSAKLGISAHETQYEYLWVIHSLVGVLTTAFIIRAAGADERNRPWIAKVMELPFALRLGQISYSLYLVHLPIFGAVGYGAYHAGFSAWATAGMLYGLALPMCLGAACLSYLAFERPFISTGAKKKTVAERSVAAKPAERPKQQPAPVSQQVALPPVELQPIPQPIPVLEWYILPPQFPSKRAA